MPKAKAGRRTTKTKPKVASSTTHARRLRSPVYKSFRRSQKIKHPAVLPGSFTIFKKSLQPLVHNWRLFLTITLIYGALSVILVRGLGGSLDLSGLKSSLKSGFSGNYASLLTGVTLFSYLVGSAGSSANPAGGAYQTALVIIMSLVVIWTLRQLLAGHIVRARDGFYRGTYPLIQFILVLLVIGLQLLPLAIGSWLYSTVVTNAIAVTGLEKFTWALLAFGLALLSLYMICSSIFGLYIVTLPDMTPMKALRSARELVRYRRWTVLRKILFLPLALVIIGGLFMIPLILIVTAAAEWIFFLLSMFTLVVVHAYMYTLYREML